MRAAAIALALLLSACGGLPFGREATPTPFATNPIAVSQDVPNGRVEIRLKPSYLRGETVVAVVRLVPSSGTLRGPLEPYIQASGFSGTATVRNLAPLPQVANAGGAAESEILWDGLDNGGRIVPADDYSLVIAVIDDQGRRTLVGATVVVVDRR